MKNATSLQLPASAKRGMIATPTSFAGHFAEDGIWLLARGTPPDGFAVKGKNAIADRGVLAIFGLGVIGLVYA